MKKLSTYLSIASVLGCTGAQAQIEWKSSEDLRTEIRSQFQQACGGSPPTAPVTITLQHNYLVTQRLEFELPEGSQTDPWIANSLALPRKNVVIKAGSGKGRIIPGLAFASETWHQVLSTDPMYARLPDAVKGGTQGCKVWYVDLVTSTGGDLQGLDSEPLKFEGSWPRTLIRDTSDTSIPVGQNGYKWIDGHGTEFSEFPNNQPLSAAIGNFQMKYADTPMFGDGMPTGFTWGKATGSANQRTVFQWNRAPGSTNNVASMSQGSSALTQNTTSSYDAQLSQKPANSGISDLLWPGMSTIPQSFVRCTVFHAVDYDPVEVGVKSFSQQTTTNGRTVTFELNADPWKLMGSDIPDFSTKQQRFRIWNAPELLDAPGEMVVDTAAKKLYFIPWTQPNGSSLNSEPPEDVEMDGIDTAKQTLYVGLPSTLTDFSYANPPFALTDCEDFRIEGLKFRVAAGSAIRAKNCKRLVIKNCAFDATGHTSIFFDNVSDNSAIHNCTFKDSLHGFVKINGASTSIGTEGGYPSEQFVKLEPQGVVLSGCTFTNGSRLYPSSAAVSIGNWAVGVTVGTGATMYLNGASGGTLGSTANTFSGLPGIAIGYSGAKLRIAGNNIGIAEGNSVMQEVTDFGAIYSGRTWVNIGNVIEGNTFTGIRRYSGAGGLADDVSCVMLDDQICGQQVKNNKFPQCDAAFVSNGGRFNLFEGNVFRSNTTNQDSVVRDRELRTAVLCVPAFTGSNDNTVEFTSKLNDHWLEFRKFALKVHNMAANSSQSASTLLNPWDALCSGGAYGNSGTNKDVRNLFDQCTQAEWTANNDPKSSSQAGTILAKLQGAGYAATTWSQGSASDSVRFKPWAGYFDVYPASSFTKYNVFVNRANFINRYYSQTPSNQSWNRVATKFWPTSSDLPVGAGEPNGISLDNLPFFYGYSCTTPYTSGE